MSAAAWQTALDHDRVAHRVAHAARRWGVDLADALQTARIGVYRAALAHDAERPDFELVARRRAIDELRRLGAFPRRHLRALPKVVSLDAENDDGFRILDRLVGDLGTLYVEPLERPPSRRQQVVNWLTDCAAPASAQEIGQALGLTWNIAATAIRNAELRGEVRRAGTRWGQRRAVTLWRAA